MDVGAPLTPYSPGSCEAAVSFGVATTKSPMEVCSHASVPDLDQRVRLKSRERDAPAMAHWLAVTTADNWTQCLATKTWGVKDHFQGLIQRTEVGDDMLFHLVGMRCAGIYRVTKSYFK